MRTFYLAGRIPALRKAAQSGEINDKVLQRVSELIVGFVNSNWSAISPSSPYNPPAVVTGNLKRSVRIFKLDDGHWQVLWWEEYSKYLEFGTTKMAPRPFLTPAVEYTNKILAEIGLDVMLKIIRDA